MEKSQKVIYLNIQILRLILCFNIVAMHSIEIKNMNKILYFICVTGRSFYVPTFFFMSFYFSYNIFSERNMIKLKERLLRLFIPYIIWPCIFFIKYVYTNKINEKQEKIKYKDILCQLLVGKPFHPVFWYLFVLLFWSIAFLILIFAFKDKYHFMLILLFLIVLSLNFFGYTEQLFANYSRLLSISICDLFYKLFYILSGFYLGSKALLKKNLTIKLRIIFISVIGYFLLKNKLIERRYNYLVLQLGVNIIFISFSLFPFDLIKNKIAIFMIKLITSYTGGIYYLHWEIKYRTFNNCSFIKKNDFMSCVINYLFCYIFCCFCFQIFKNIKLKYLFI
jgi:hypothetical protein